MVTWCVMIFLFFHFISSCDVVTFSKLIHRCRLAGTVGAIVTCPLEVVKTRLQSSSSQFYPPRMNDVGRKHNNNEHIKASTQRRDLYTSILRKRSQVSDFFFVCINSSVHSLIVSPLLVCPIKPNAN